MSGWLGIPLTPVAMIIMAWLHDALATIGQAQSGLPFGSRLIIVTADELRRCPEVQFERFDIGLEPVGQLVLGNVRRPVWRERHVGEMIDLDLIVQRQGVISQPPVVANALFLVDNQRIDTELR